MQDSLQVCHVISAMEMGGSQISTLRLIKALRSYPVRNTLLVGEEGAARYFLNDLKHVQVIFLKHLKRRIHAIEDLKCAYELKKIFSENTFDIVHTHSSKSSVLLRLPFIYGMNQRPKLFHTYHGLGYEYWQSSILQRLQVRIEKKFNRSSYLQFVCEENKTRAQNIGLMDAPTPYTMIHDILQFNDVHTVPPMPKKGWWIGSVLSFKEQKRPLRLLELIALSHKKYPAIQFILVGDGPMKSSLQKMALSLKLPVHFTGAVPDVSLWMKHFDCFISTSRFEGLSMAELECLHYKVPMVITQKGGIGEFMQHGRQGYFFEENALPQALQFITRILEGDFIYYPATFDEARFSPECVAEQVFSWYQSAF